MFLFCLGEKLSQEDEHVGYLSFSYLINLIQNGNARKDKTSRKHLSSSIPGSHQACDAPAERCVESLCGRDEDTELLQAASPRPGQTQCQMHKAMASPQGLGHNEHVALQYHFLFKALHPQCFWLAPNCMLVWGFLLKNVGK